MKIVNKLNKHIFSNEISLKALFVGATLLTKIQQNNNNAAEQFDCKSRHSHEDSFVQHCISELHC
ncbi:hypothetical protein T02_15624 [Trichinella nativa]|uniref:Uncharacterized protein n=1 Tax=Trichinella nativa TaxID=6335 RepID=A0A0V1LIV1_9BILA|nr:hypothetical protein T02_15624 [Trichinella nativa]